MADFLARKSTFVFILYSYNTPSHTQDLLYPTVYTKAAFTEPKILLKLLNTSGNIFKAIRFWSHKIEPSI